VAVPAADGERFELCTGRLVVGELSFVGEHLGTGGQPVAAVDDALDIGQV
jgi:hypothetical protein